MVATYGNYCMSNIYQERIQPGELLDLAEFASLLCEYYNTTDYEVIKVELKKDFKNVDKIKDLINFTKFSFDDIVINITKLYDKFFTASNIRLLRIIKDELSTYHT